MLKKTGLCSCIFVSLCYCWWIAAGITREGKTWPSIKIGRGVGAIDTLIRNNDTRYVYWSVSRFIRISRVERVRKDLLRTRVGRHQFCSWRAGEDVVLLPCAGSKCSTDIIPITHWPYRAASPIHSYSLVHTFNDLILIDSARICGPFRLCVRAFILIAYIMSKLFL